MLQLADKTRQIQQAWQISKLKAVNVHQTKTDIIRRVEPCKDRKHAVPRRVVQVLMPRAPHDVRVLRTNLARICCRIGPESLNPRRWRCICRRRVNTDHSCCRGRWRSWSCLIAHSGRAGGRIMYGTRRRENQNLRNSSIGWRRQRCHSANAWVQINRKRQKDPMSMLTRPSRAATLEHCNAKQLCQHMLQ